MPLAKMACNLLSTADGHTKSALSREFAAQWFKQRKADLPVEIGTAFPPCTP